jgi:hypothetical protein
MDEGDVVCRGECRYGVKATLHNSGWLCVDHGRDRSCSVIAGAILAALDPRKPFGNSAYVYRKRSGFILAQPLTVTTCCTNRA